MPARLECRQLHVGTYFGGSGGQSCLGDGFGRGRWILPLARQVFLQEMKVTGNVPSKTEIPCLAPLGGKCILKTPPLLLVLSLSFPKWLYCYFLIRLCHWTFIDRNQIAVFLGRAPAAERCGSEE